MKCEKYNKKTLQYDKHSMWDRLRIWSFKKRKKLARGYTVKCGCGECKSEIKIFLSDDIKDDWIEIGGIISSRKEWADLLIPLLTKELK